MDLSFPWPVRRLALAGLILAGTGGFTAASHEAVSYEAIPPAAIPWDWARDDSMPTAGQETIGPRMLVHVNGQLVVDRLLVDAGGPAGYMIYQGSLTDIAAGLALVWDIEVDPDPSELVDFESTISITNLNDGEAEFSVRVEFPICPHISGNSSAGASVVLQLETDDGGGRVRSTSAPASWFLLADGIRERRLIWSPFFISITGSGTAATEDGFGAPIPSAPGPIMAETLGVEHVFYLTDGDTVHVESHIGVTADLDDLVDCVVFGDIDGNGSVDFLDLTLLMASWGVCRDCPADLNGDDIVGQTDLLILLLLI